MPRSDELDATAFSSRLAFGWSPLLAHLTVSSYKRLHSALFSDADERPKNGNRSNRNGSGQSSYQAGHQAFELSYTRFEVNYAPL